ncbi:MAG: NUDIX domain-containing protein [Clostridia bacterium]
MQDIKIKNEQNNFKYRVCGLIKKDDKFLLIKMDNNNFYCLPGGHVEIGESSITALNREMLEETDIQVGNAHLFSLHENFYKKVDKTFHEIGLYYLVEPTDKTFNTKNWIKKENDKGVMKNLSFEWFTSEEIKNCDFKPTDIKNLITKNQFNTFNHIICDER